MECGHTQEVERLLKDERILDRVNKYHYFYYVCAFGSLEMVQSLINDPRVDHNVNFDDCFSIIPLDDAELVGLVLRNCHSIDSLCGLFQEALVQKKGNVITSKEQEDGTHGSPFLSNISRFRINSICIERSGNCSFKTLVQRCFYFCNRL